MQTMKCGSLIIENHSHETKIVIRDSAKKGCGNCGFWDMKSRGVEKPVWACDNVVWVGDEFIDVPNFEQIHPFIYHPSVTEPLFFCPPRNFYCSEWKVKNK